jgi:hypothetical protein
MSSTVTQSFLAVAAIPHMTEVGERVKSNTGARATPGPKLLKCSEGLPSIIQHLPWFIQQIRIVAATCNACNSTETTDARNQARLGIVLIILQKAAYGSCRQLHKCYLLSGGWVGP